MIDLMSRCEVHVTYVQWLCHIVLIYFYRLASAVRDDVPICDLD